MKSKNKRIITNEWFWAFVSVTIGFIILQGVFSYMGLNYENLQYLESQLQSCQDKVPVWGLEVTPYSYSFWTNQTGEWVHHFGNHRNWLEFYKNGIEFDIWDMTKEELQLHKEVWCKINELENCEVIK